MANDATARPATRPDRDRRSGRSFEAWSWLFMRFSGLVLVFLALTHFAITHIINDVVATDHAFVSERWDNPAWRIFDWTLLALALLHGLNGVRWVVGDYARRPATRTVLLGLAYGLSAALFAWGTFTVVTF